MNRQDYPQFLAWSVTTARHIQPELLVTALRREVTVPSKKSLLGITMLLLIVGFWFAAAISESDRTLVVQPHDSRPLRWHEGGTLHNKTFGDWIAATPRNRLATAGDWIKTLQRNAYGAPSNSVRLRGLATELRDCVDGATAGAGSEYGLSAKPLPEAAAVCVALTWGTSPPTP